MPFVTDVTVRLSEGGAFLGRIRLSDDGERWLSDIRLTGHEDLEDWHDTDAWNLARRLNTYFEDLAPDQYPDA